jgi:hypothetical protein
LTPEDVDRARARGDLSRDPRPARDEALLPGLDTDFPAVDGERISALHHDEIFIEVMNILCRGGLARAAPEGHLTAVRAVEAIALDIGGMLRGRRDSIRRMLHERREVAHRRPSVSLWGRAPGKRLRDPDLSPYQGEVPAGIARQDELPLPALSAMFEHQGGSSFATGPFDQPN